MIEVKDLSFSYRGRKRIFSDFSMQLGGGIVCGLLGRNGTGKSTLLNLIAGLLTPSAGCVEFGGVNTRLRRCDVLSGMFFVSEEFSLPEVKLSAFVDCNAPFYPKFSRDDMKSYLDAFELDSNVSLAGLSMGQRKKVLLSFAFATNVGLLLMDEPTNGLDIPCKGQFRRALSMYMSDERSVIISTHQVMDVDNLLDHVLVLGNNAVLLNETLARISSLVSVVSCGQVPGDAFYSQPSPVGYYAVVPRRDESETDINIELLFNAVISSPALTEYIKKGGK